MERTTRPTVEASHRIAQVLGVPNACLYCEDDELAEVILAWGLLTHDGQAKAKKSALGLVAGQEKGMG